MTAWGPFETIRTNANGTTETTNYYTTGVGRSIIDDINSGTVIKITSKVQPKVIVMSESKCFGLLLIDHMKSLISDEMIVISCGGTLKPNCISFVRALANELRKAAVIILFDAYLAFSNKF